MTLGIIGPPWVQEMARDLTALGGVTVLSLVTFARLIRSNAEYRVPPLSPCDRCQVR